MRHLLRPVDKQPIANFFCDTKCKGSWQKAQREAKGFSREWLYEQYVLKQRSANDIAREVRRDSKRVWEWLRDYGIETRPRGTDYGQCYKPGMKGTMLGKNHSPETCAKLSVIAKADGRKPWGKDNQPYWIGRTGKEHPSWRGGLTPERQAVYSSQEWVEAVKVVWARDNATCQQCHKHHSTAELRGTFHIHHIVSFMVRELRCEPSNLVLLCRDCHKWVHGKENTNKEWIKENDKT